MSYYLYHLHLYTYTNALLSFRAIFSVSKGLRGRCALPYKKGGLLTAVKKLTRAVHHYGAWGMGWSRSKSFDYDFGEPLGQYALDLPSLSSLSLV